MNSENERQLRFFHYADEKINEYYSGENLNSWTGFTMKSHLILKNSTFITNYEENIINIKD